MGPLFLRFPAGAILSALCLAGCNSLFYFPSRQVFAPPEKLNIRYSDHYFESRDGLRLHGRLLMHAGGEPASGLFVQFHGNAQNLSAHYLSLAWVLGRGYDLFVFDYPGYGESEGRASRPSTLAGGRAALDFVADSLLPSRPSGRLVLVGQSLGGAVLMRCLPEWERRGRVDLAVVEASFPSYRKVAQAALAKSWLTWPFQSLAYLLVGGGNNPGPWIPRIAPTPLLVTACKEDPVIAPRFSREIFRDAHDPKWYWEYSPCGHIQVFRLAEARERLLGLLDSLDAPETSLAP